MSKKMQEKSLVVNASTHCNETFDIAVNESDAEKSTLVVTGCSEPNSLSAGPSVYGAITLCICVHCFRFISMFSWQ